MQLIKPVFSIFAEDFELMKAKLSADEIVEMLSALSELCFFGETEYKPKNKIQEYFWDKLKDKFFYDLSNYKASVENGKKGGRPRNKAIKNPEQNPEQNPANNLNKTQDKTQNEPTKKPLVTCHLNPEYNLNKNNNIYIHTSSDKTSDVCAPPDKSGSVGTCVPQIEPEAQKTYAFEGNVIKLNEKDFNSWQKAYPDLNLYAELLQRDKYLATQPPDEQKRWFLSTSKFFIKQNALRKAQNSNIAEQYGNAQNENDCWF